MSNEEFRKAINQSNQLTPKEINVIIRNLKSEQFEYKLFDETLFEVRFELAKSRIMDTNIKMLQVHLNDLFHEYDPERTGLVTILQVQEVLLKSKKVNLTPFQI